MTIDANTKLLLHMDHGDSSAYANEITYNGSIQFKSDQKKFGTSSMYMNGGDYITIPDHNNWQIAGDFTLECWVRFDSLTNLRRFFTQYDSGSSEWHFYLHNTSGLTFYVNGGALNISQGNADGWAINTWYHVAAQRRGNQWNLFRDGVSVASTVNSFSMPNIAADLTIGRHPSNSNYDMRGYMDELRISGLARYPSTGFTPPTEPFVDDANTRLLIHCEGDASSSGNTLEMLDGAVFKSGLNEKAWNSSMYVNATADQYVKVPNSSDFVFDQDFTIDFWCYPTASMATEGLFGFHNTGTGNSFSLRTDASAHINLSYEIDDGGQIDLSLGACNISQNTWNHCALVRSGNTLYWLTNGVMRNSVGFTASPDPDGDLYIGIYTHTDTNFYWPFPGYIDEFRYSNTARWTDDYVPPGVPYGANNTYFLAHFDGDAGNTGHDVDFTNQCFMYSDDGVFTNKGCLRLPGTSDYISIPDSSDWDFGSNDFTIECWVKIVNLSSPAYQRIITQDAGGDDWVLYFHGTLGLRWFAHTGASEVSFGESNTNNWTAGKWYHIAIERSGNTWRLYQDGSIVANTTSSYTMPTISAPVLIGTRYGEIGTYDLYGFVDEVRISNTARFDGAFTSTTEPYESDSNTKLLLHFGVDESENKHYLKAVNDPQIEATITKWNGSMYFDGTNYLEIKGQAGNGGFFNLGKGNDWTIDFWWYCISNAASVGWFGAKTDNSNNMAFMYDAGSDRLYFNYEIGNTNYAHTGDNWVPSNSTWYHIALVKDGNTLRFFVDGEAKGTSALTTLPIEYTTNIIGGRYNTGGTFSSSAHYLDEFRMSGSALWTTTFTPPTEPMDLSTSPYIITGNLPSAARLIVINENDYSVVEHTDSYSSGSYEIGLDDADNNRIILARRSDGETVGFGGVTPEEN
jgi:hypothetical protein